MPTEDLTLDELNYIMNLQRQEAFDDAVKEDNETAEDKLQKILKAPNYSSSSMSDLPVYDMSKDKSEKEKRRLGQTFLSPAYGKEWPCARRTAGRTADYTKLMFANHMGSCPYLMMI